MIGHILHVVGARPNFMKAAPVLAALARRGLRQTLVHTGQHYDVWDGHAAERIADHIADHVAAL